MHILCAKSSDIGTGPPVAAGWEPRCFLWAPSTTCFLAADTPGGVGADEHKLAPGVQLDGHQAVVLGGKVLDALQLGRSAEAPLMVCMGHQGLHAALLKGHVPSGVDNA